MALQDPLNVHPAEATAEPQRQHVGSPWGREPRQGGGGVAPQVLPVGLLHLVLPGAALLRA